MNITTISSNTHKGLIEAVRSRRVCLTILGMDINNVTPNERYRLLIVKLLLDNR
ncbi:hypothetical protein Q0M94_07930 [Deinococcus radiomollis]|uniref:hypothetical protein n=1 Tax=Deinococcus radiomollis TaxID=468916 RepID=UPI0038922FDC